MKRLVLVLTLAASAINALSNNKPLVYTRISQEEGLTSTVNCIYKEKDSDVWIGTPNGLYSYDGYSLTNHSDNIFKSRRVFHISCSNTGDLFILTDRHILKKEPGKDGFRKVSVAEEPYFCAVQDNNTTWIGGRNKIYRYENGNLEIFCETDTEFDCRSLGMINENTLLCCSNRGKILIDLNDRAISEAPYGNSKEVSAALIDKKGRIWIAYYNNGITVYTKDGQQIRNYRKANSKLSNDIVLCLTEKGNTILAGTDGGGINIINPETDEIQTLTHISGDRSSFPAHSIKSLHTDHYGNIWAGSIRDGLIHINRSLISFYTDSYLGLSNGLSNPTVLCLYQDKTSDMIWIGTDGEGVNRFDPHTSKFEHYSSTFKKKVVSIAEYSESKLAISVYGDGIYMFDKNTGNIQPMHIADTSLQYQIRLSGRSINLLNEADGDILMYSNAIYRYDKSTGRCTRLISENQESSRSNFLTIGHSEEGIWLHDNFGIYLLNDDSDRLILKGKHPNGLIHSGHLSDNGIIWLATEEGLCRFSVADGTFHHVTSSIFSDATSVICDKRSRIWIGTERGLSAYLSESGTFTLFGESDGAKSNEYLPKPKLLSKDGNIYMGGVQGLLCIDNEHTIETTLAPQLTMREIYIDGVRTDVENNRQFKIPSHSQSLRINLAVKEKDMFRHRQFRFSVSGHTYETNEPRLVLNQIPKPGTHDITVSCTKRNGEWTEPTQLTTLKVPQPWFLSWWFICVCLVLIASIFFLSLYTINKRKSNQLKMAVKERENKVYEEKVQMLINISHELRTPLTLVMAPLKRLLKSTGTDDSNYPVLNRIYRQSRRMRNLLDMVLDLRKMEISGSNLKTESTAFNKWIENSVEDIVNEEKAEGIEIVYDFDKAIGNAEIDRQKCDTVLMNLLINAIKHSLPGDTITIKTDITEDGMIRTSISDQGPGLGNDIDPEKMFTRFYQSKNEKYGSGIGLSYSKILVEMHGGSIGVYNNEDRGATFWWEIPVSADSEDLAEPRAFLNELLGHSYEVESTTAHSDETFDTSGMKLMIVDDSQDLLDFLREALCDEFSEIITVTGGHAALREISSGRLPDIIVSDVNMPEGDGFWLCNSVKSNEKYSHIPFVLLTARGEDYSQSESYRLGADGFLAKPFETETLMELVRSLLRNKSQIRKRYLDTDDTAEAGYGSNEEDFIIRLNKIISDNLSNSALDQQLMCREMGMSRALLYNKMKAITGAGAKEYITKIRIEKAKSLIETTSLTIAEISDMTGFASQSYFSTAFKNYEGMTPSAYKQTKRTS